MGSPDIKKNRIDIAYGDSSVRNELSDIAGKIGGGTSARGGSILRSSNGDTTRVSPSRLSTKLKNEDIEKLEKKCQRMIFEKEDKFLENEQKLKNEDQQLQDLEVELLNLEQKLKEKNQENNLLDFKLRDMARSNDEGPGYLKPHPGIHQGILSSAAGQVLNQPISLANNYLKSNYGFLNSSVDMDGLTSRHSRRPVSRYSRASHMSNYDDDTISSANKRFKSNLPKIKADRNDTNYVAQVAQSLRQPSIMSGSKHKAHISKSAVSQNKSALNDMGVGLKGYSRVPSHLRASMQVPKLDGLGDRDRLRRNKYAELQRSIDHVVRSRPPKSPLTKSLLKQRNVDAIDVDVDIKNNNYASNPYTDRKRPNMRPQKLSSKFPVNTLRQQNQSRLQQTVDVNEYATHATPLIGIQSAKHRRNLANNLASLDAVSISQSDNLVSTNITTALASASNKKQLKTVEMRRKEAEQAIMKTANIKKNFK